MENSTRVQILYMSKAETVEMTKPIYNFSSEERAVTGTVINIQATMAGRLTHAAIEDLVELLKNREDRILELEKRLDAMIRKKFHSQILNRKQAQN